MTTVVKTRVGWGDLFWVAWRGHRALILVTAVLAAVETAAFAWTGLAVRPGDWLRENYFVTSQLGYVGIVFGALVAVFWGAPLVAREHEQRTNVLAWGQDVSASRWLTGQVALLGLLVAGIAAALGSGAYYMIESYRLMGEYPLFKPEAFEAAAHVQVGYALLGLAAGVAAGALIKRTLTSMAVALVVFAGVRAALAWWGRQHYLPPVHTFEPWTSPGATADQVPYDALPVAGGFADANGVPVDDPEVCLGTPDYWRCVEDRGIAGRYAEFHPADRAELFQWIETGVCLVLAAGLLVLAWYWVGRARRV